MSVFEQAIAIETVAEGHYRAQVSDQFSILTAPNGGYLMGLVGEAARCYSKFDSLIQLSSNFSAKADENSPMDIYVERFGGSRQYDRLQLKAMQGERLLMQSMATLRAEYEPCLGGEKPPAVAPVENCIQRPVDSSLPIFEQVDVMLAPETSGWLQGDNGAQAEIVGWLRLPGQQRWSSASLMLAADACPPSIFSQYGPMGWVPTIEMSTHIKALPASEWLQMRFHSKYVGDSLLIEDGELWDDQGNLVAVCRQLAQFIKVA